MHSGARKPGLPHIDPPLLDAVRDKMRTWRCEGTLPVVMRGEIMRELFFVAQGRMEARYKPARGGPLALTLGPGDFFGERALFEDAASDAAVRPVEPGVVLAAVPLEDFRAAMEAQPRLKDAVIECVAARRALLKAMALPREAA